MGAFHEGLMQAQPQGGGGDGWDYCVYYTGVGANRRDLFVVAEDYSATLTGLSTCILLDGRIKMERVSSGTDYPKVSLLVPCYVDGELQQAGYVLINSSNTITTPIKLKF